MRKLILIPTLIMGLAMLSITNVYAADKGEVKLGVSYVDVNDDEGRFREDQYRNDGFTGGIESLYMDSTNDNDDRMELYLRAFAEDEYRLKLKLSRLEVGYILLDAQFDRRYYDGSNEPWDPSTYGLTGSEIVPDNRTSPAGTIDDGFYTAADFADRPG